MYCFNPLQARYKRGYFFTSSSNPLCFNPLQARYKPVSPFSSISVASVFQSLIGTLQTGFVVISWSQSKIVSIPYRHATNIPVLPEFVNLYLRFNPLQARYKLLLLFLLRLQSPRFQSLIGTLQTRIRKLKRQLQEGVSIPYRHATNHFVNTKIKKERGCFNPLQARYKRYTRGTHGTVDVCFNPLQARYKPRSCGQRENLLFNVSIPYRHATNVRPFSFCLDYIRVSIPYRHATNQCW